MTKTSASCVLSAALALLVPATARAAKPIVAWHIKNPPAKALKPGDRFNLVLSGQIEAGWHLYALEEPPEAAVATIIGLTEGDPADLLHVEEGKPKISLDPLFNVHTGFFTDTTDFTLNLKLAKNAPIGSALLHVLVRYQSCNDHLCLPSHTDTIEVQLATVK
ncbi:protein-disulfide reductase DsbD domain-containing protein [Granulicella sp. L60]|uniref:protein-disulfide reductase DsbD domain-containing protein n=1 Tax=Granulicella sp. L60 TaxID=1641866 RepID=UPI00131B8D64|nr:protein-disulfide reductase DsbD domain-containing protein [Granulicella sp. L60]